MKNLMKNLLVLGYPIDQSLSPILFKFLGLTKNIDLSYKRKEIKTEQELKEFLKTTQEEGFNVTIPYKEIVSKNIQTLSSEAIAIGAVNTVKKCKEKGLVGFNTDIRGIEKTFFSQKFVLSNCLVLGAGGASRALAFVLGKLKAKSVLFYNRCEKKSEEITKEFSFLFPETEFLKASEEELSKRKISFIANTTPLGMKDSTEESKRFFSFLSSLSFCDKAKGFDLIYTPLETDFIKVLRQIGVEACNGLEMFVEQAIASFHLWFEEEVKQQKIEFDSKEMQNVLRGLLLLKESKRPIFLTGFMGVGKTTIGKELANILNKKFLDTDQLIQEKQNNSSISEIFSLKGEKFFRQIEKEVLEEVKGQEAIIALGGGTLLDSENIEKIKTSGESFFLSCDLNFLFSKLELLKNEGSRPLLHSVSTRKEMGMLWARRKKGYLQADWIIETTNLSPLESIYQLLRLKGTCK